MRTYWIYLNNCIQDVEEVYCHLIYSVKYQRQPFHLKQMQHTDRKPFLFVTRLGFIMFFLLRKSENGNFFNVWITILGNILAFEKYIWFLCYHLQFLSCVLEIVCRTNEKIFKEIFISVTDLANAAFLM